MKKFILPLLLLVFASTSLMKPQVASAATPNHNLVAKPGPKAGEVSLSWRHMDVANNYHLVYGTEKTKYQYGVTNIGWVTRYTVKNLTPGRTYYFALVPVNDNVALYTGEQVSAQAMGGAVVTPVTSVKPVTSIAPVKPVVSVANKHNLVAKSGLKVGEVKLSWRHIDNANNYHLVYGTERGKYRYGALNIGWITGITVRHLVPGQVYYFALVPVKDNVALYTSAAVSARAYGGEVEVIQTSKEALRQPKVGQPVVKNPVEMPKEQKAPELSVSQAPQATGATQPTVPAGQ
jgi:hypothetical protein